LFFDYTKKAIPFLTQTTIILMQFNLSHREESIKDNLSNILKIGKNTISLGAGEPDFSPPRSVIQAAKRFLDKGYTRYSPQQGKRELITALTKKMKKKNKINISEKNVMVTNGSTEAIFLFLMSAIDPKQKVIVPDPGYLAYIPMVKLLNGIPILLPLSHKNKFCPTCSLMQRHVDKKTKAILINSPSNPTGQIFSKKTLEEIADFAIENNLFIISDEAYEDFTYGKKHISIGSLNGIRDRVISLFTFSKSYAMTGFRIGYVAGPEKIISAMTKLHLYTTISAPTISQMAAIEALKTPNAWLKKNQKIYDKRRKTICQQLQETNIFECQQPEGAFYAFPKIISTPSKNIRNNIPKKGSSIRLAKFLAEKAKVITFPGTYFGPSGEGHLRLSFATEEKKINQAFSRIRKALKKY
jgi:aminotransferase